jgi:Ca2+-transporting ATPase
MSTPNPALWWVVGGALVFLAMAIYVPFLREIFSFAYLHFIDIAICFTAGIGSILWFEALKIFNGRNRDSRLH